MIYTRVGSPVEIVDLILATGRWGSAVISCRHEDGKIRKHYCSNLKADFGLKEIESALIKACGRDFQGRIVTANGDTQ